MRVALAALLLLIVSAVVAGAQSPAAQVRAWATRYHEDPPSIDRMRAELTQAVTADPSVDNLVALAEVCFIWGDVRAKTTDDKLAAYDQGRQAAQRAVELAPRSVTAHLWYAIDTGRWGQTKGMMRSLSLLPIVKRRSTRCWRSTPSSRRPIPSPATSTSRCPACWAAIVDRAEKLFRTGLGLDPTFTSMRVGLAKTLLKKGRVAEARRSSRPSSPRRRPTISPTGRSRIPSRPGQLLDSIRSRGGRLSARDQPSRARERSRSSRWRRAMRRLTAGPRGGRRTRPPSTTARNPEEISSAPQAPRGSYHL